MGKTEFCAHKASSHHKVLMLLFFVILCLSFFPPLSSSSSLSFDFYAGTCPAAEMVVKNTVRSASDLDPTIPGKLLRLLFHDCFVEGCDASVLLQGNGTERSDPANKSLGGFSVIDAAKRMLEIFCPETVSCADILALAARDAVEFAGGPNIQIPTGRRDGKISLAANVRPNIIDTSFTLDEMAKAPTQLEQLIAAHSTTGSSSTQMEISVIDSSLDRQYAAQLTKLCTSSATDDSVTVSNDPGTPLLFDNQYYRILLQHKGLFQSDSALLDDERTRNRVLEFANNQIVSMRGGLHLF
ncbi:UNVERIFIED_CONTAM: Peroxidase 18 [Sesamum latifolium]|uniref:Peroxidase n=1 Tax=Sesamum latifolium TaxID=2727402 RepID=A0AAW2SPD9_9LAMI